MLVPILTGEDLTAARHLCHYYGVGGHTGGSFADALIRAIEAGDQEHRERLLDAFPQYRRAIHISTTLGADRLAEVVAISGRLATDATSDQTFMFPAVTTVEIVDGNGIIHRALDASPVEVTLTEQGAKLRVTHTGITTRHFKGHR